MTTPAQQPVIDVESTAGEPPLSGPTPAPAQQALTLHQPATGAVGPALPPDQIKAPVTAAQAKVEAIASLTMAAYAKAATLEITDEELAKLSAEFPDDAFQSGAAGKENLIYIQHAHLRDRLNDVFRPGRWAIVPRSRWAEEYKTANGKDATRVYVEAMLVIRGAFVAEAIGEMSYFKHNDAQNYGDCVEGAKTAALRRCCKELGVGLQAWKKEWCEGWWARKRGQSRQTPPQARREASQNAPGTSAPVSRAPTAAGGQNAPAAPSAAAPQPQFATDATRKWMLEQLKAQEGGANRETVKTFLEQIAWLAPFEALEELELRFVPVSKAQLQALAECIGRFAAGDPVTPPYPPNGEPKAGRVAKAPSTQQFVGSGTEAPYAPSATPIKPIEVPRDPPGPPATDPSGEWFMQVISPIPRKGMTRADYLKAPDTIGSLFAARHGTDEESQAMRQRLWGFVNHYEAKPWTGRDGKEKPPSATDVKFREALDAFAEWFEKTHPDEKL